MAHATETIAVQPVGGREGSGMFSGPVKLAVGGAVVVAALAYFAFMAFQSATVYYYTVGELQERGATAAGETVRVSGKLVDGSFSRDTDSTLARFALTDGGNGPPGDPRRRAAGALLQRALGGDPRGQLHPRGRLPKPQRDREMPVQVRRRGCLRGRISPNGASRPCRRAAG